MASKTEKTVAGEMRAMNAAYEDWGKLVLRCTVGILLMFHAVAFLYGDPSMPNRIASWGLPSIFAYIGFLMQFVGGILVIVGAYTRIGGALIVVLMICAVIMAHSGLGGSTNHLFSLAQNPTGTMWDRYFLESQAFYLMGGLAVALLGAGRYGLNIGGRWN